MTVSVWPTSWIEIIGEATQGVSDKVRDAHPKVPWRVITGMRDRATHGYFDIDLDVVWNTPLMPRISRSPNRSGLTDVATLDRRHPTVVRPSTRMR